KAIEAPGQARVDWHIIADLAKRIGYPMRYTSEAEIWQEIVSLTPPFTGITYERLEHAGIPWPCPEPGHPGIPIRFTETFPRGKGKFVPAEFAPAKELPDEEYPFVLNTGRVLQHWHTGTMTRRAKALDEIAPSPFVDIHPEDAARLGLADGAPVRVESRRGAVVVPARGAWQVEQGNDSIPFYF